MKSGIQRHPSPFLVVIPTYNEIENIENIIRRLDLSVSPPLSILVIDDNSPDGTAGEIEALQEKRNNLYLLNRTAKLGLGSAYMDGFRIGIQSGADYIITMDSDLSHDPAVINQMMKEMNDCDLVIGSRYTDGGQIVDLERWRRFLSKGGNMIARNLLHLPTKDSTSGFRCYRASMLAALNLEERVKSHKYIFLVELLALLVGMKFRIKEIPISFTKRLEGKTKVNIGEMVHGLWTLAMIRARNQALGAARPYETSDEVNTPFVYQAIRGKNQRQYREMGSRAVDSRSGQSQGW